MPAIPAFDVVARWDNGRCTIRMRGRQVAVNHLYLPGRSKPYFAARLDGVEACQPAASYTALLRRLDRLLSRDVAVPASGLQAALPGGE